MTPQTPDPLPLRDIHLPDPVSWWPPAPGWWGLLLLALLLAGLGFLALHLHRRSRLRRYGRKALSRLQAQYREHRDSNRLAADLSVLLRRMALSHFPRPEVAGLTGRAWLDFLDRGMEKSRQPRGFTDGPGRVLIEAPYHPGAMVDPPALLELCRRWIDSLPAPPRTGAK